MTCLHDYQTIKETKEAIREVCTICKKKLTIKKDTKGRYDNKAYRENHHRDLVQPYGKDKKTFIKLYGKPITQKK